ncbi:hypothetical protein CERZMDRAFT_90932 [Cercospora zeae-maydis SCOH1-5]|uniref:Uncharacterized protein n=1 Tax=Cercospora zeae-maydis SCOH1-5 TaxID=717836 RepID=A0A6A6FEA5_9PEZI|nr:hypothetical protein CERZMDRAFT_90932 [Cercospora zeae-maydis SCOH1-5]
MAASYVDRIVGSAKDLTKSAFSGTPGIEAEIQPRDFFGLGKRVGEPGSSSQGAPQLLTEARGTRAPDGSFRNCGGWVKDVESDYQEFVCGSSNPLRSDLGRERSPQPFDGAAWDGIWESRRCADARRASVSSHDHEHSGTSTPIYERRSDGKVVYQEDGRPEWRWRHEWKRINRHLSRERLRQESRTGVEVNFELDHASRTDVQDMASYNIQSAALARLQQLKQHLMSIKPVAEGIQSWTPDWEMQQHERCDWTVEREYDRVATTQDEPPERYYFTCKLRGCHHRLLRQSENLTLEIRQRVCVHDDCGYVSDTVENWLRHVTTPHHNLQHTSKSNDDMDRYEDENMADWARSDKSSSVTRGGVWLIRTRSNTKLDLQFEFHHDLRGTREPIKSYERWSTELRLGEWDSPS